MSKIESDRLDWLRWRQGGLGGSDVMQILLPQEARPYGSPWDVWTSKKTVIELDKATDVQTLGNWLERPIAEWVAEDTDMKLISADATNGPEEWMRCTPDFWLEKPDAKRVGLECKLSFKSKQWADGVPPYVMLQALWCMICTDTDVWHVGAFLPFAAKRERWMVERDPQLEKVVIEACREWWNKHIIDNVLPDIDGSAGCLQALRSAYPLPSKAYKQAEDDEIEWIKALKEQNEQIKAATVEKKRLTNLLASATADFRGIESEAGRFNWDYKKGATRFDSKAFKAEHVDLYERFLTTGEPTRSARLYPKKEDK